MIHSGIMHVEMSIDQMLMWRPTTPDLAGHRVPGADGLFLAGASTHPSGKVPPAPADTSPPTPSCDATGSSG